MKKRIFSLILALVVAVFLFVPASAEEAAGGGGRIVGFWDAFGSTFDGGQFGSGGGRDAYTEYVSQLQTDLGTTILTDGGILIPLIVASWDAYGAVSGVATVISHGSVGSTNFLASVQWQDITYDQRFICFDSPSWPFDGTYTYVINCTLNNMVYSSLDESSHIASKGSKLSAVEIVRFKGLSNSLSSFNGYAYAKLTPTTGSLSNYTSSPVDSSTRTGSLSGNYIYTGDNGTQIYENVTIVSESEKTFYDPTTGTTTAYDHYVYDYSTRTYTLYDAAGNVIAVITYGDDQLTISKDGTDTGLSYLGSDSGSGGSSGGSSIWDFLGKIVDWLGKIVDGITGLASSLLDGIKGLFVPSEGFFSSSVGDLKTNFEGKMGLITYPILVLYNFFDRVTTLDEQQPVFTWTNITWMDHVLIPAGQLDFNEFLNDIPALKTAHDVYLQVVNAILIFGFLDLCYKKYRSIVNQ